MSQAPPATPSAPPAPEPTPPPAPASVPAAAPAPAPDVPRATAGRRAAPREEREPAPREERAPTPRRRAHGLDKPEVTELEIGSTVHKVVPDPKPLDVDGIRTMTVGSLLWLAVLLGLLPFLGTLQRNGDVWWLWTCLAGFGLGLIGVEYCRRRKAALDAEDDAEETS